MNTAQKGMQVQGADAMQSIRFRADADVLEHYEDFVYWQGARELAQAFDFHTAEQRSDYLAQRREIFPFEDWEHEQHEAIRMINAVYYQSLVDKHFDKAMLRLDLARNFQKVVQSVF